MNTPHPRFTAALKAGRITVRDATCPAIHTMLQAAEKGVPFMPLRGLIGSDAIRSPKRMIALMVGAVGPVSAFVPNTPIVASLLPVVESWCQRRRISPSKVLLPLSFATVLGGTMTLNIGRRR